MVEVDSGFSMVVFPGNRRDLQDCEIHAVASHDIIHAFPRVWMTDGRALKKAVISSAGK